MGAVNMSMRDWVEWHRKYDTKGSWHAHRLLIVQKHIANTLDQAANGTIVVVSICAGQGRDLIGALVNHPRRTDVTARLVELDERNVEIANHAARAAGLENVVAVGADAGVTDAYSGATPADLVLICGVFGHLSPADAATTIRLLPQLCAPGATVIWTHWRRLPLSPVRRWGYALKTRRLPLRRTNKPIRAWFGEAKFEEVAVDEIAREPTPRKEMIGVHRFRGAPTTIQHGTRLFTFGTSGARHA